ncbi:MAG: glycosyltransferase family 2 protein [bacterium]
MFAALLFAFCCTVVIYIFLGYPLTLVLFDGSRKGAHQPRWIEQPTVTLIFAAHNETVSVGRKLDNALSQDYPPEKLDVIVVDDCSNDGTAAAVQAYLAAKPEYQKRTLLLQQSVRLGKTAALNRAAQQARGEVLVFTDANAMFRADAVKKLVEGFDATGKIGVVCGELHYHKHPEATGDEESWYWDLEIQLKKAESRFGTLLGANGSIYALRRELYIPLREDIISDLIEPLLLAKRGFRTVYQPEAVSVEASTRDLKSEFRRKKRIIQRGLHGLWNHRELLNPLRSRGLALMLWSHKVLRWFLPLWLIGILIATFLLRNYMVFHALFVLQIAAYGWGALCVLSHNWEERLAIFRIPAYIMMVIGASAAGIWGFLRGEKVVFWEPQR